MPEQPLGKINRLWVGGSAAAKAGGRVMGYYARRPFLDTETRQQARDRMALKNARTVFNSLSLLKGTALKMAQQLSLESDVLPEAVCKELAKAYHQVPPINRALVRQVIQNAFGKPPEKFFSKFDSSAFAAASLGQVHAAEGDDGAPLAVKIQYPGIARTIDSDMGLLRHMLRPVGRRDQLLPILKEIAERLQEEVNYLQEADNTAYFASHLRLEGIRIPRVRSDMTAPTVLTTTRMPGLPLDRWLEGRPDPSDIDQVAQTLQRLFISGLYDLHVIHADPHPGNFIIDEDLTVGLVDFGCIKRLDPVFVEHYRRLSRASAHQQDDRHFEELIALGLLPSPMSIDNKVKLQIQDVFNAIGNWFGRLYRDELFDFGASPGFIADGKAVMSRFQKLRQYVNINPEFTFLDRTRYGLLRLFEQMGARVRFRNSFEW